MIRLAAITLVLVAPAVAWAGVFGGFGADGSYLRGTDQVCTRVSGKLDVPTCVKKSAAAIAKLRFDAGSRQRGDDARYAARSRGSRIEITPAAGGEPVAVWDAGTAVSKVGAVYLSRAGDAVAVEYSSRFGGRSVEDVVVIALPETARSASGRAGSEGARVGAKAAAGAADVADPEALPPESPEVSRALAAARKAARKKRWKAALAAAERALDADAGHPEALFWRAAGRAQTGDRAGAVQALEAVATGGRPRAALWRVEARRHPAFRALRADADFRRAVGLDRRAGAAPSTYERLVGYGGSWEQAAIPCEQARANLSLATAPTEGEPGQRFELVIRSRCQGRRETTRLDGLWRTTAAGLELVFPNPQGPKEAMQCRLERCADASGEDCLRCQPEPDIEFLFRIVRR